MRIITVMTFICLFGVSSGLAPAKAETASKDIEIKVKTVWDFSGFIWYPPQGLCRSFDSQRPEDFIHEIVIEKKGMRMPELREPLPLVAYVIQDKAGKTDTASPSVFPAYRGYLILSESNAGFRYSWTGKSEGSMPADTYVDGAALSETPHSWWFIFRWGEPQRCEIARQYSPAGFFLWMRSISFLQPHYRIFFTAGSAPDDTWAPEFDISVSASATNATQPVDPADRPRLKNPLPGMRPAPWYPPEVSK